MHISSLPGPYGIGSMGKHAYDFVDFLCKAGQRYWQILPLSPTGYGDSPYQSFSIFAGNSYLIDLDALIDASLLQQEEVSSVEWCKDECSVDYGCLYENRGRLLKLAYERYTPDEEFYSFVRENPWLEDYGLFMALKEHFGGIPWQNWPEELVLRNEAALTQYKQLLSRDCGYHSFVQYIFYRQWQKLRAYANGKGIRIIGDVPNYLPLDSAEVWANPELFQLTLSRRPKLVAGCPPDLINEQGQNWGNPLYNWENLKADGYEWWIRRLKAAGRLYDMVRLNHFRSFERYWAIPVEDGVSRKGFWMDGPGMDFIRTVQRRLPKVEFIAEDLGGLTDGVRELESFSGYPGMRVVQYAFDSRGTGLYVPDQYPENSVCYTSIHDNPPLKSWLETAKPEDRDMAVRSLNLNEEEGLVWGMIRGGMASASRLCIVQMQDYLVLGEEAQMNRPGTQSESNWAWRAKDGVFTGELANRILELTKRFGRQG